LIAPQQKSERTMSDIVLILFGLAFFALSIGYAAVCDWL
jgi:hypothetical protein